MDGTREPWDLLGGFLGIEPAGPDGRGLRPVLGWAVRRSDKITAFRRDAREFAAGPPVDPVRREERLDALRRLAKFTQKQTERQRPHTRVIGWDERDGPAWMHDVLDLGDGICWPARFGSPGLRIEPLSRWRCVSDRPAPLDERPDWLRELEPSVTHRQSLWLRIGSLDDGADLVGSVHGGGPLALLGPSGNATRVAKVVLDGLRKLTQGPPRTPNGPGDWMRTRRGDSEDDEVTGRR